jgi:hypothetical protein
MSSADANLIRRCLRRIARGTGPWLPVPVAEVTADGSTVLVAVAVPLPVPVTRPTPEDAPPRGRSAEVPRDVLLWLRANPSRHYSDIIDAMTGQGHSRTQAAAALTRLVRLGFVEHTARGLPYRANV